MQIAGRTFLITGGASGLGAATARKLAAAGAEVAICDVDAERGKKIAGEIGSRASFFMVDVVDESQVRAAISAARGKRDALHGAVWK
jgi:NAD(P)-dependent dehydrogenase (short-subunit alcohol dehydrogenase family)